MHPIDSPDATSLGVYVHLVYAAYHFWDLICIFSSSRVVNLGTIINCINEILFPHHIRNLSDSINFKKTENKGWCHSYFLSNFTTTNELWISLRNKYLYFMRPFTYEKAAYVAYTEVNSIKTIFKMMVCLLFLARTANALLLGIHN